MTSAQEQLNSALAAWPLDSEQKRSLHDAVRRANNDQAEWLAGLLREAHSAVVRCAVFLSDDRGVGGRVASQRRKWADNELWGACRVRLRPLSDYVLARPANNGPMATGGIIVLETKDVECIEGDVVAVGPGARDDKGRLQQTIVNTGDRIVLEKRQAFYLKLDREEFFLIRERYVLCWADRITQVLRKIA